MSRICSISFSICRNSALPLIALIAAMVTHERQREIGLLMSMGAKRNVVFFLVMAESLVLAAIGGIAGVVAGLRCLLPAKHEGCTQRRTSGNVRNALRNRDKSDSRHGVARGYLYRQCIFSLAGIPQQFTMNPYDAIRNSGQ